MVKEINVKNKSYYFFNDLIQQINTKKFGLRSEIKGINGGKELFFMKKKTTLKLKLMLMMICL